MPNFREALSNRFNKDQMPTTPDILIPEDQLPQPLSANAVARSLEFMDIGYKKALAIKDPNNFTMARRLVHEKFGVPLTISGLQAISRMEIQNPTSRDDQDITTLKEVLPIQLPLGISTEVVGGENKILRVTLVNFLGLQRILQQMPSDIITTDLSFTADPRWEGDTSTGQKNGFIHFSPLGTSLDTIEEQAKEIRARDLKKYTNWETSIAQKLPDVMARSPRYKHTEPDAVIEKIAEGKPLYKDAKERANTLQGTFLRQFRNTDWYQWIQKRELHDDGPVWDGDGATRLKYFK